MSAERNGCESLAGGLLRKSRITGPLPPKTWMISDEAIRLRADELGRQNPARPDQDNLRAAEAEYKAAAGVIRPARRRR